MVYFHYTLFAVSGDTCVKRAGELEMQKYSFISMKVVLNRMTLNFTSVQMLSSFLAGEQGRCFSSFSAF